MGITTTLSYPFSGGAGSLSSDIVPGVYQVALDGRPFNLDLEMAPLRHIPVPLLRVQNDTGAIPGEQSLSSEGLWPRAQDSWHYGAGQTYLDKADSNPRQFRSSKGINIWEKFEMSLLQDVASKWNAGTAGAATCFPVGAYFYVSNGIELYHTQDLTVASPTWTASNIAAGEAWGGASDHVATDGYYIYTGNVANGVHRTVRGSTASSHYSDVMMTDIWYVRGRLIASSFNVLYNITASGAAPAPLYTHPNAEFNWVSMSESQNSIFMAGWSGDKSYIYSTRVRPDGTALDIPVVAAELPDGEIVRSIQGYLGYLCIGSDKGVRLAATDNEGNLTLGALISTPNSVYAFEPQDRFVWFSYYNYDAVSTGLGRLDLSIFTEPLVPAYASDLMATDQGNVYAIATFQNRRAFMVLGAAARNLYVEDLSNKVSTGTLDSGLITYGLPYEKVAYFLDVQYKSLVGTHVAYITTSDGGAFTSVGQHMEGSDTSQFTINQLRSTVFEIREELRRSTTNTNTGPILSRHTLKAFPAANTGRYIIAPLLVSSVDRVPGSPRSRDPLTEVQHIETLKDDQTLVSWQEGTDERMVVVADYDWNGIKYVDAGRVNGGQFEGTCVVKLKEVV